DSRAPDIRDRIPGCQFLAQNTGDENNYFERSIEALGVSAQERAAKPDWPVTSAVEELMRSAMESNGHANMLAVLAVAEGTYLGWADRVNNAIAKRPDDFWFAEWIDLHTGDYFESVIAYLNAQLDQVGPMLNDQERALCL